MSWTQLIAPNTDTQDNPGMCLRMATKVFFGDVGGFPTARTAWDNATETRTTREMPNVAVPVWFSWVGTIDGVTQDWGHVAVWIPERRQFLSSPLYWSQGWGQSWVDSLEDIERILGCTYLGYSSDIQPCGYVAGWTPDPTPTPEPAPVGTTYTVGVGDNLWGIAVLFYGDGTRWPEIYEANAGIIGDNPSLIQPGMVLTIPGV